MLALLSGVLLVISAQTCMAVEMRANIDMAGYKGTVGFVRAVSGVNVTLNFNPAGSNTADYDVIELWSLPALFGRHKTAAEVCDSGIGTKLQDLISDASTTTTLDLAETVYFHRSVLVYSSAKSSLPKLCATILPSSDSVVTRRAKFIGPVFGTVWIRTISIGSYVYGDLTTISASATETRDLKMFLTGTVDESGSFSNRCKGLSVSGGTVATGVGISNSKLSKGTFSQFTSSISAFRKNLAVVNGNSIVACAILRSVSSKTVTSPINWESIKGSFVFTQNSPFDSTTTTIKLDGLQSRAKGYHVHKFPVPQRLSASEMPCAAQFVSGHFNPYSVDIKSSPAASTGSSDQYEIGDLSGKYGDLSGKDSADASYIEWNLPLFGVNSIVGRSVVIHNDDATGSRLLCSTIGYPAAVKTGISVFKAPAYGTMYFRQDAANPDEESTVFVELASQSKTKTSSHNWHVHVYPVGNDAFASDGQCASAGGHYNPSEVSVEAPYSTECRGQDPLRCELGDLSRRLGQVDIVENMRTQEGKYFFTDEYLPLSGSYSVLGRSIVVHAADAGAPRYACANVTQLHPVVAKTGNSWVGTDGSASAEITLEQATEFDPTKATGTFENLADLASGYHIHVYTISSTASNGNECAASSVAGHYNPFNVTTFPSATVGTYDKYEVGDLSNKYGLLASKNSSSIPSDTMDTNLPLHTRISASDRSIVIHKAEANARWKCSNLLTQPADDSNGHVISATAKFATKVLGTVKLRQIVYEDAGAGLTSYELDVLPKSGSANTLRHNWHIHIEPVTNENDCADAAGHYDPYNAIKNTDYETDCSPENPLFCEVGDLSKKQDRYDIGGGRRIFHDVDTPLHTAYTVLGRSIVFHVANGGSPRYACANIVPDSHTYTLAFSSSTSYTRYNLTKKVADALGINRLRVVVLHNYDVPVTTKESCSKVMVHIAGGESISNVLSQLVDGTLSGLDEYAPTSTCKNEEGATVLGTRSYSGAASLKFSCWAAILGVLVTLWMTRLL